MKFLNRKPDEEIPALKKMLSSHGFSYWGFTPSKGWLGCEKHYFNNYDCSLVFGFPSSGYANQLYGISGPFKRHPNRNFYAYLSEYVDFYTEFNKFCEAGFSKEEALAKALTPHISYIRRLYSIVAKEGRSAPTRSDKEKISL